MNLRRALLAASLVGCADPPDGDDPIPRSDDEAQDTAPAAVPPPLHVPDGVRLEQGGTVVCDRPDLRARMPVIEFTRRLDPPPLRYFTGGGAVVADLDADGRNDVALVGNAVVQVGWQQPDGSLLWTEAARATPTAPYHGFFGGSAADVDDDGDLDLLVTGYGVPDLLLRNDGGGVLTDATEAAGLTSPPGHLSGGSSWSDVDGDGDLDLFIGGHGPVPEGGVLAEAEPAHRSRLYLNDGAGRFTDGTHLLPEEAHAGHTFVGGWIDADGDGDDDLYLVNDFGETHQPGRLLWNDGGVFRMDDGSAGLDAPVSGMGFAVGDLDGDGDEDFGIPAWGRNRLFLRDGGRWYEASKAVGWEGEGRQVVGWGSVMADVDHDGRLDIATAYGRIDSSFGRYNTEQQPDAFHLQLQPGYFVDQGARGRFDDRGPSRGVVLADLDGNGWLDSVKLGLDGVARLDMARCGENRWLTITLRQPAPNTYAVGATVRVEGKGRRWMSRVRAGGTGYASGGPPTLHFGLAEVDWLDEVEVTWPDGRIDVLRGIGTRQHLVIARR